MEDWPWAHLDLAKLPSAVEDAPPFSATDVLGERLASEVNASEVSFLIADFSGHALIRLGHAGKSATMRTQGAETAARVPLGRALPGARWPLRRSSSKRAGTGPACSRRSPTVAKPSACSSSCSTRRRATEC